MTTPSQLAALKAGTALSWRHSLLHFVLITADLGQPWYTDGGRVAAVLITSAYLSCVLQPAG
jgi:hypothetical protein